ncbi:uncharacterized protein J3D65DRAFT_292469 [Phyllosticta citribraziliensis]|uniref:Uncharacterized protein n=1 Tax=Phyllosticta citribraziliensis TaxID=989973 RepID=A0ABR1LX01_9PEZI
MKSPRWHGQSTGRRKLTSRLSTAWLSTSSTSFYVPGLPQCQHSLGGSREFSLITKCQLRARSLRSPLQTSCRELPSTTTGLRPGAVIHCQMKHKNTGITFSYDPDNRIRVGKAGGTVLWYIADKEEGERGTSMGRIYKSREDKDITLRIMKKQILAGDVEITLEAPFNKLPLKDEKQVNQFYHEASEGF